MLADNITFLGLIFSSISIFILMVYLIRIKNKNQLHRIFIINCLLTFIWAVALIAQIILSPALGIEPIKFDYIVYIGACFLPVSLLFTGLIFANTKIKFRPVYTMFFLIPILSLLVLWSNDFHHLFYTHYSVYIPETSFGPYFIIHSVYSYVCIAISLWFLISYAIKNSGFFSKQSLLIIIGTLIPTLTNILSTCGVIQTTIYITPITYIITLFCYAFAMFKLELFESSPIALQRIVDNISDSYLVLDSYNKIIDFNDTFLKTFNLDPTFIRNLDIFELPKKKKVFDFNTKTLRTSLNSVYNSDKTVKYEVHFYKLDKYFVVEITGIMHKNSFLGTIVLFKDITQHILDLEEIKDKQDMLMEKERLASLGQLIGGISHNLKTPIMSISGAAEGISDLIKEYEASIGDPEVTPEDHHAIASDMKDWVDKIHSYTEYMSDIITAVKGQAVNLSENENDLFTIDELFKRVNILMKHEIRNASLTLNTNIDVPTTTSLHGDINSLVQVVNNLITNAIQAYNGKKNQPIDLSVRKENNNIIISVSDNGCGMPKDVQDKLFKSMITTKGKNGTGLGMFMSYSTIKGHFNGDITFTSKVNVGTTFNITIPLS